MPLQLADNSSGQTRTATNATIKRASATARRKTNQLDRSALTDLDKLYRDAVAGFKADIDISTDAQGSLRLEVMRDLLAQAEQRLSRLGLAKEALLSDAMLDGAVLGVQPFAATLPASSLANISHDAVQFAREFIASDGLQLSDRIWRNNQHTRQVVTDAIQQSIIQGHGAAEAAQRLLVGGQSVPADLQAKMAAAGGERIKRKLHTGLLTGDGNPLDNALRLFRTEINRAHGEAYQASAFEHPDAIGTRFLLSPNHPQVDICDMHSRANLHGLGPGVYPKGKNPWPAHPNTLSYVEVVFDDEITAEDKAGKTNPIDWLDDQAPHIQQGVVGGRKKRAALVNGLLTKNEIATPWRVLKKRYERRGIDTEKLAVAAPVQKGDGLFDEALGYVQERGLATGFEHAVAVDQAAGAEFFKTTSRKKGVVSFDRHQLAVLNNPRNNISLIHNHPRSTSLSDADMSMGVSPGILDVVAVGHDGSRYTSITKTSRRNLLATHEIAYEHVLDRFIDLATKGRLTVDDADSLHGHLVNLWLDRKGLIDYRFENTVTLNKALARQPDSFESDILDSIDELF